MAPSKSSISVSQSTKLTKAPARKGRPRSFEPDKALERALQLFWRKGYEGTSLSDLTEATGVNRPSLYAAFGDKEALFRKALDRYAEGPAAYVRRSLEEPKARSVVERLLHGAVDLLTDPRTPQGCLLVQGALSSGKVADPVRRELITRRRQGEAALRERLKRAMKEGDLPPSANSTDLARYVATTIYGMAVQAAGGATRAELQRVIQLALRAWPAARGARHSIEKTGKVSQTA
jgi:AcrR family transcriptional regulator